MSCHATRITIRQQQICQYIVMTMTKETKSALIQLRIRPSMKAAAEKAATDDERSLTSLIEKLLADYLRKKGYLPKG